MDSLINIQSRGLDACESQVNNLRNQVNLNKGYAEKLLLYNIISPYIRNLGLNPTNIRLCKRNVNHLQYEIIREYHRRL